MPFDRLTTTPKKKILKVCVTWIKSKNIQFAFEKLA